ncbi:MAG: hypothetical protein WED87_01605, partial [Dehalococcoidia bacterium]
QNLPGMTSRTNLLPTVSSFALAASRGRQQAHSEATGGTESDADKQDKADFLGTFEQQINKMSIITGTPKTVIPKVRHVLEYLRPGSIFFWDGDGAMTHDDSMRSLRLMGEEVIPAVREMSKSLDLQSPFETDPKTNQRVEATA